MPTTAQYLSDLVNQKNLLAQNLTNKGVEASNTETLNTLVPKVNDIQTGTDIQGIIEQYYVYAGENIAAGSFVEFINGVASSSTVAAEEVIFNSSYITSILAISLTDTKVLVVYRNSDNYYGTAIVLNINDNIITSGSSFVFNASDTVYISVVALTDNKVLVAYSNRDNYYGTATVLNIDDNTTTSGSSFVFNTNHTDHISVTALSSNKVLVAYQDYGNNYYGTAIVLNINGNTITSGSSFVFSNSKTNYISVVKLSNNKVLITYVINVSNTYFVKASILAISSTTITSVYDYVFHSGPIAYNAPIFLSDNKVLVAYRNGGGGSNYTNYGTSIILNINGNTIIPSNEFVFNTSHTTYISVTALSSNKVLVAYRDYGNNDYGTTIALNINDSAITSGSSFVFNNSKTNDISVVKLSNNKVLIAYQDYANNSYGTSILLSVVNNTISKDIIIPNYEIQVRTATTKNNIRGIAKTSGIGGNITSHNEQIEIYTLSN